MAIQAIFAERAFTPHEEIVDAVVLTEDSKIIAVGKRGHITIPESALRWETRGQTLVPGFVDMHIHGAGGHDVMEGTSEALAAITAAVALYGTTSLVATTVTASEESTVHAISGIAAWMHSPGAP